MPSGNVGQPRRYDDRQYQDTWDVSMHGDCCCVALEEADPFAPHHTALLMQPEEMRALATALTEVADQYDKLSKKDQGDGQSREPSTE